MSDTLKGKKKAHPILRFLFSAPMPNRFLLDSKLAGGCLLLGIGAVIASLFMAHYGYGKEADWLLIAGVMTAVLGAFYFELRYAKKAHEKRQPTAEEMMHKRAELDQYIRDHGRDLENYAQAFYNELRDKHHVKREFLLAGALASCAGGVPITADTVDGHKRSLSPQEAAQNLADLLRSCVSADLFENP